jgi:hypothetical protein
MANLYTRVETVSNAGATVATFGANANKQAATTKFSTRELVLVNVAGTGFDTTPTIVNSNYAKAVVAIQELAEVQAVFTPGAAGFAALVVVDTASTYNTANSDTSLIASMDRVVTEQTGISTTVTVLTADTLIGVVTGSGA